MPGSMGVEGLVREGRIRLISVAVAPTGVLERLVMSSPGHGTTGVTAAITVETAR